MKSTRTGLQTDTGFLGLIALGIYSGHVILSHTDLQTMFGTAPFRLLWMAMMGCLILRVLLEDTHTPAQLLVWAAVFPMLLLLVKRTQNNLILLQMSLVLTMWGIPFRKTVRCLLCFLILWTSLVFILCFAGVLPNYEFRHSTGSGSWTAMALGFKYYSYPSYISMTLTMGWFYLRGKKAYYSEILAAALVQWFLYRWFFTVQLVFYAMIAFLVLFALFVKVGIRIPLWSFWRKIAALIPALCFAGTWILVWLYDKYRYLFDFIDRHFVTLAYRLKYSVTVFHQHPIPLFGQYIYLEGHSYQDFTSTSGGLYLDSNYVYLLLVYGIVFSAAVLIMLGVTYRYIAEQGNTTLFLWFGVILFLSVFNNFLTNPIFNPCFLLFSEFLLTGWPGKKRSTAGIPDPV